jgi:hypothetical protein
MTETSLKIANELKMKLNSAAENYEQVQAWRNEHLESDKNLSFSKVGSGWVGIPAATKGEVLDLVHDIAFTLYVTAKADFENYKPE